MFLPVFRLSRVRFRGLSALLDPPTVMMDLQGVPTPVAVNIPAGFPPPVPVAAFPGAVGIWVCGSESIAGDLIGHLRANLGPLLPAPGRGPRFIYTDCVFTLR